MRSPLLTISLALAASLVMTLAVWSHFRGGLDELFGAPIIPPGGLLYPEFRTADVVRMEISTGGTTAIAIRRDGGWFLEHPWNDRADARAAASILQFTQALRVEDAGDVDDTDRTATGMIDGAVRVRLLDEENRRVADYRIGSRAPWMATVITDASTGETESVPTTFIETRDRGRRSQVYICAGDVSPLFRDGLRFLRDHRPFFFNPAALSGIRLRTPEGELSVARESPAQPWRIVKPLDLPTDPAAMRVLLERLFALQAMAVENAATIAPVASDAVGGATTRIALSRFPLAPGETADEIVEAVLDIRLPDNPEERIASATVSDRPGAVFRIPVKPEADLVSLADLPLSVNTLRDPTLTNLNIAQLSTIAIRPLTGREILIDRQPGRPWEFSVATGGETDTHTPPEPANERRLFELLNAVTRARATAFESDAAVDLSPWGLDRPVLTLAFIGGDSQVLELDFGIDDHGGVFAMRRGSSTVTRLEDDFLKAIPVRQFEWRLARVWSVSKVDLTRLVRLVDGEPPLVLDYDFLDESWRATRDGEDATPELVATRANHMLDHLVGIECERWLAVDDEEARAALARPTLRISVFENEIDEFGDAIGEIRRDIGFAPAPGHPGFHYGLLLGEPHPFLIPNETIMRLTLPLFDDA
jgi:hypothetical protein